MAPPSPASWAPSPGHPPTSLSATLCLSFNSPVWLRLSLQEADRLDEATQPSLLLDCRFAFLPPPFIHLGSSLSPSPSAAYLWGPELWRKGRGWGGEEGHRSFEAEPLAPLLRAADLCWGQDFRTRAQYGGGGRLPSRLMPCHPSCPRPPPGCTENPGAAAAALTGAPDRGHGCRRVPLSKRGGWGVAPGRGRGLSGRQLGIPRVARPPSAPLRRCW